MLAEDRHVANGHLSQIKEDEDAEEPSDDSGGPTEEDTYDAGDGSGDGSSGDGCQDVEFGAGAGDLLGTNVCMSGRYNSEVIVDEKFEVLDLRPEAAEEAQACWAKFLKSADTGEAAGEAIYSAVLEAAPTLQGLFKTPRAVMAMRFLSGLNQIFQSLADPEGLKAVVETLGFSHLDLEVTQPRVIVFRDAICELMSVELGVHYTAVAHETLRVTLNYIGGAYIFLRKNFSGRIKLIESSWRIANGTASDALGDEAAMCAQTSSEQAGGPAKDEAKEANVEEVPGQPLPGQPIAPPKKKDKGHAKICVPTNFPDMFRFNAAVMGYGGSFWFAEVLHSFDTIVRNVSNTYRLQEECDVLSLRLAKCKCFIDLPEFKAVMMSSLRSLIAKAWDKDHEIAWSWLWENVERLIKAMLGKPAKQEKALERLWGGLEDSSFVFVRTQVYATFFQLAPNGMNYFRQSNTRLHFIADRVIALSLDMYKDPERTVSDLSALGLRHVGYAIPTDLFGPFVTACVQVVRQLAEDDLAEESFRWSLSLISRILMRVINEGSTIVMRAINDNSGKQLRRAVGCAPRSKRADWLLKVTVGTQSISPLKWAIKAGSFEAAEAILCDLLTIRADRDRYYFGMDALFRRHPRIIQDLGLDAPVLLPVLFDGLVWRSRVSEHGYRKTIYFVEHLLIDADGGFSKAIEWVAEMQDPKLVRHPVVCFATDIVWSRVAYRLFLYGKLWFLFTLLVFILAQCVLFHATVDDDDYRKAPFATRLSIFLCRCFIYCCSLSSLICVNVRRALIDYRSGATFNLGHLPLPAFLLEGQAVLRFLLVLTLLCMFFTEPILACLSADRASRDMLFSEYCPEATRTFRVYSVFSAIGMLLYYLLLVDLAVFSTRVSAFALVLGKVLSELVLCLTALLFAILCFASAGSALREDYVPFRSIPRAAMFLLQCFLGMTDSDRYMELLDYPLLTAAVVAFMVTAATFLVNLLVAQMSCAYSTTFQDMLGYARLKRSVIVADVMRSVRKTRWERFVESLELDRCCEFGEGDVGFPGAISVLEPASEHRVAVDTIRRFGGSTSPMAVWPEEEEATASAAEDRLEKVELYMKKMMKKLEASSREHRNGSSIGGSSAGHSSRMTSGMTSMLNSTAVDFG